MAKGKVVAAGEEDAFYRAGQDWEADRQQRYERSERRRGWRRAASPSWLLPR